MVLALTLHGAVWLAHTGLMLSAPMEIDFGEGPVLQLAYQTHLGQPLYRALDEPPYQACLYTPLYIAVVSLTQGDRPSLGAARAVSAFCTLAIALAVAAQLKRRHGWLVCLVFTALFLGHALTLNWSLYCRVDTMALMFSGLGLLVADARLKRPLLQEAFCALCFSLAVLTKQSFIAAPAAVFFLWLPRPLRSLRLFGLCVVFTGLPLLALNAGSEGQLFNLLFRYNALTYSVPQMLGYLHGYFVSAAPLLALGLFGAGRAWREHRVWVLYTLTSLGIVLGSGRMFSWYNYFLELHLALSVLAALAVLEWKDQKVANLAVWLLLASQLLRQGWASDLGGTYLEPASVRFEREVLPLLRGETPPRLADNQAQTQALGAALHAYPGETLAEYSGEPVALGRLSWFCDPSTFCALSRLGLWDEELMVRAVEQRRFQLILLTWPVNSPHFTPPVLEAIKANYRNVGNTGGIGTQYIYVPR